MTNLKTRPELLTALRKVATRELSASDLHKQRVSFVMGSLKQDSGVTRAQVDEVVSRQDGKRA
jgi:hypothetical protein